MRKANKKMHIWWCKEKFPAFIPFLLHHGSDSFHASLSFSHFT